jgi:hypothetical protein
MMLRIQGMSAAVVEVLCRIASGKRTFVGHVVEFSTAWAASA